jgi:biopolymer transport protein ExbB
MNNERWISARTGWFLLIVWLVALFSLDLLPLPFGAGGHDAVAQEAAKAAPAAAPAAQEAGKEKPAEQHSQNFLVWVIKTSGPIGAVILILSIWFVSQTCRMFYELRPVIAIPPDVISQVEELIGQRDFKSVFEVVKDDDSFFSRCLSTGVAELPNGLAEARDVMERVGESLRVEMEKKISMLAVLGTLGPMIGLLGTLSGMIKSFSVIAMSDTQLKASQVAEGISEALLLTFEGVALSVPAIYFFSLFRNRVSFISTQAMLEADQILRHFAHAARGKQAGGAAAPAGAPKTGKGA